MTAAIAPSPHAHPGQTEVEADMELDPPPDDQSPLLSKGRERLSVRRRQLRAHASQVALLLRDLEDRGDELHHEAWDLSTAAGAQEWVADRGMVFRALRRNHFDVDKTHDYLVAALNERMARGLGGQIPDPPTSLLTLLPLPVTDRLGHPVAVLRLCEVVRDDTASLAELKEWTWWGLELLRRVLRDWWVDSGRGTGAEGVVLVVDVAEAGYRNMEVELLPTLFSVANNNFPGMIESVYVVNAGWSQRTLWNTVVKRILPRSALEKVTFLQNMADTASVFNLDSLPKSLGGDGPAIDWDSMLKKHHVIHHHGTSRPVSRTASRAPSHPASRALSRVPSRSRGSSRSGSRGPSREPSANRAAPSRNPSVSSIADLYYTAPSTPLSSLPPSRPLSRCPSITNSSSLGLASLAMTKTTHGTSISGQDPASSTSTAKPATVPTAAGSTVQRIKSLSDFHLYISPSRLANRDLLSDSEDDEPRPPPPPPRRVTLRPALFEGSIAARRAAARAAIAGDTPKRSSTPQESYASRLLAHHAKHLEKYCAQTDCEQLYRLDKSWSSSAEASPQSLDSSTEPPTPDMEISTPATTPPPLSASLPPSHAAQRAGLEEPAADVQFSANNPWFGYPVVRVPDGAGYSIRPRYGRNRKRDLVKTLLWLFILRLQSLRASLENALGLTKVTSWMRRAPQIEPRRPTEGLRDTAVARREQTHGSRKVTVRRNHDWVWMLIGFLVCRGTWAPFIGTALDSLGLGGLKDVLGLA